MKYLDWNDCISRYFFSLANAGKNIHFYLTKSDLINLGRKYLPENNDTDIWEDYINAIKFDEHVSTTQSPYSPIDRPLQLAASWDGQSFPPYIAYLVLYIIPLTESDNGNFNSNNYYGRINEFLRKNGVLNERVQKKITSVNFQKISHLWNNLEEWSIITKNCDLGIFELKKFGNPNWIYVGKPLSQCLFSPKEIRKLPELFLEAGLVPGSTYSEEQIKKILLKFGKTYLGVNDSTLRLLNDERNELGHSIIEITSREYKKWKGESHQLIQNGADEKIKRNYTVAPLFLQFEIHQNTETINFSYRLYSSNDYPVDLKFDGLENIYETRGWSKTIKLPFREKFELKDEFNRWIARFPSKEIRLFRSGASIQLSNQYWVESDVLSKTDKMYLLCRTELGDSITEWGKCFKPSNFEKLDIEGLPDGYELFFFQYPPKSHPEIYQLSIPSGKLIQLAGGLRVGFRTYLNLNLPEVELINADGNEEVYIEFRQSGNRITLGKKITNENKWQLPDDIELEAEFYIRLQKEILPGPEIAYSVINANNACMSLDSSLLSKRDLFGRVINGNTQLYAEGSNVFGINWKMQQGFVPDFMPISLPSSTMPTASEYFNERGNLLLNYLTVKKEATTLEFYDVFENINGIGLTGNEAEYSINPSRIKRISLSLYDFLGYLDYDYQSNRIVVNPPQLILIPTKQGRKTLLIGGRDKVFIDKIISKASRLGLVVDIYQQQEANSLFLIPDTITISASMPPQTGYGVRELKTLCNELRIIFNSQEIVQFGLQEFSASIDEYERFVFTNNETFPEDYNWARKIFNPQTLRFEKESSIDFDTSYTLVEYKLREWEYYHKLWVNGKCFNVDKNWARYMAIKWAGRQVIFYDSSKQIVAIPASLPLPRLFAESVALLSGRMPLTKSLNLDGRQLWYVLHENVPSIFIQNFFMKLGQTVELKSL
ncbi:hypothetical protein [Pseudobacter ginsenosidimutans]|uniref:Uncharacterized protein n=1 Tax=Pseudobacter ginsenosidimutans TaxID=661488 RepID=A0A4V2F0W1_9BACT|nr:hypothetical protein [Pseudobacter ginsenosidimutans]QEC41687.1 hypothetical protein FSB84_08275 [Pseudobacter ginsenosidimutans]RZS71511.1 hypothetical protein EV199_3415 [Pseudobacter ginsenosidimutans]